MTSLNLGKTPYLLLRANRAGLLVEEDKAGKSRPEICAPKEGVTKLLVRLFEIFVGPANPWPFGPCPEGATGLSPGFQPWEPSK
jgi:hypothetical protein